MIIMFRIIFFTLLFLISSKSLAVPATPIIQNVISNGCQSAIINWTPGSTIYSTEIYVANGNDNNFYLVKTVLPNNVNTLLTGLLIAPYHRFKIRSVLNTEYSAFSAVVSTVISCFPPANFRVVSSDCDNIKLAWNASFGAELYRLYRSTNSSPFILIAQLSNSTLAYSDLMLSNNSSFSYSIQAVFSGYNAITQTSPVFTKCPLPPKPQIQLSDCGNISISWHDYPSENIETGFEVYRSESENGDYSILNTLEANVLNYTDNSNLEAGKTYFYKIKGIFGPFSSDFTTPVSSSLSMYSIKTGSWTDPTTWSCGRVPNILDDIIIQNGHIINIENNIIAYVKNFYNNGELLFGEGSNLILN
jgi:hypothetical protein